MREKPIIDVGPADDSGGAGRARRAWRIGAPLVCVVALLGVLLLITLYTYDANRRATVALSRDLVDSLARRIDTEVNEYLAPAARTATMLGRLAGEDPYRGHWP